jgi:hypothetical protein
MPAACQLLKCPAGGRGSATSILFELARRPTDSSELSGEHVAFIWSIQNCPLYIHQLLLLLTNTPQLLLLLMMTNTPQLLLLPPNSRLPSFVTSSCTILQAGINIIVFNIIEIGKKMSWSHDTTVPLNRCPGC